jgi:LemA protein
MSSIASILAVLVMAPVAVVIGAYVARRYRRLVALRLDVTRAWADIDVLLRLRHDELLALAETIRAVGGDPSVAIGLASRFASIEPWLSRAARYEAEQRINVSVLRLLNLLAYHRPLRRNDRFASIRQQIMALDELIQSCRDRYNALVTINNGHCERLPDRLLAGKAGLRPRFPLRAAADERRAATRTGVTARAERTDPHPERGRRDGGSSSTPLCSVVLSPDSTAVEMLP